MLTSASLDRAHRHIGAAAHERLHRNDAEHHCIPNDTVHLIALEQRLRQRDRDAWLLRGGPRLDDLYTYTAGCDRDDAGECLSSRTVENGNLISGTKPKNAHDVLRFVCRQLEDRFERVVRRIETMHEGIV